MTPAAATHPIPERSCVGCRSRRPKRELLRLVLPAGDAAAPVAVDPSGRAAGRGAYLCRGTAVDCLALARRRRGLARAFRTTAERVDLDALGSNVAAVAGAAQAPAPERGAHATPEVSSSLL